MEATIGIEIKEYIKLINPNISSVKVYYKDRFLEPFVKIDIDWKTHNYIFDRNITKFKNFLLNL